MTSFSWLGPIHEIQSKSGSKELPASINKRGEEEENRGSVTCPNMKSTGQWQKSGKNVFIFFVSDLYADEYAIFKIKLYLFVMIK